MSSKLIGVLLLVVHSEVEAIPVFSSSYIFRLSAIFFYTLCNRCYWPGPPNKPGQENGEGLDAGGVHIRLEHLFFLLLLSLLPLSIVLHFEHTLEL